MSNGDEIRLLLSLQNTLRQAKQELKNDLTRLAVKKMPLMIEQPSTSQVAVPQSQSSVEEIHSRGDNLVELEPLDLDIE